MARRYVQASGDVISRSAGADYNNYSDLTFAVRIKLSALPSTTRFLGCKEISSTTDIAKQFTVRTTGQLALFIVTDGTGVDMRTADADGSRITAGLWWDVFMTVASLTPRCYIARYGFPARETAYTTQTTGTGTPKDESTATLRLGNNTASTGAPPAALASFFYMPRALSLREIQQVQLAGRPPQDVRVWWELVKTGAVEPDWSGRGNHGGVFQTGVARHPGRRMVRRRDVGVEPAAAPAFHAAWAGQANLGIGSYDTW
jgi:hypothetical protein